MIHKNRGNRRKTNYRYGKKYWKISDRKKIDSMNNKKEEYYMG